MKGTIVPIKPEVVVKVIECGPLRIGGHVRIMFSDGSMVIKQRAFICRCGKSSNQPFCDGSHVEDLRCSKELKRTSKTRARFLLVGSLFIHLYSIHFSCIFA